MKSALLDLDNLKHISILQTRVVNALGQMRITVGGSIVAGETAEKVRAAWRGMREERPGPVGDFVAVGVKEDGCGCGEEGDVK